MMNKQLKIAGGLVIATAAVVVGMNYFGKTSEPSASNPSDSTVYAQSKPAEQEQAMFSDILTDKLDNIIANYSNLEIAVSVADLKTGKQYNAGESDVVFMGASTTKLITAIVYLHEVDQGNATLDQAVNGAPARQLIKQMIEDSNNQAWHSLADFLGDKEQNFASSIDLASYTKNPDHTINSSDMAKLLTLLYQDKLISNDSKELLLGFMESANYASLIKSALPTEATVYHKYGTLYGNLHDTAIVQYKNQSFAIVIFTKNPNDTTDDYTERVELIHQITQTTVENLNT